jgi:hypothetical protein
VWYQASLPVLFDPSSSPRFSAASVFELSGLSLKM